MNPSDISTYQNSPAATLDLVQRAQCSDKYLAYVQSIHAIRELERNEDARMEAIQITLFKAENEELRQDIRGLETAIKGYQNETTSLKFSLESLAVESTQQQKEIAIFRETVCSLQRELAVTKSNMANISASEKPALETKIKVLQSEVSSLQRQLDKSKADNIEKAGIQRQFSALQSEMVTLKKLNESLAASSADKNALQRQVSQLQIDLENEKKVSIRLQKSSLEQTELEKSYQKDLSDLRAQLKHQTALAETLLIALDSAKEDHAKKLAVLEKKLESLKNKNTKKAVQIEHSYLETPPVVKPIAKRTSTVASSFSTTPFLTRKTEILPPSPKTSDPPVAEELPQDSKPARKKKRKLNPGKTLLDKDEKQ